MTEIAFHFNAPDKLAYACRLLRKACASGARTAVTADPETLAELDQALWTFSQLDFIPHCSPRADAAMPAATPVILADKLAESPVAGVAVNLGERVPAGFERFERLIEIVSNDESDRALARQRWQFYKSHGYPLVRHDLAAPAEGAPA